MQMKSQSLLLFDFCQSPTACCNRIDDLIIIVCVEQAIAAKTILERY